ncbi:hypothetical protein GOODEAATRI_023978, partial [Goodea atripinnis]
CTHLQVLELERITDLSLQVATELCKAGLKSLQMLVLTHTSVSGQAILHFHSKMPLLLPEFRPSVVCPVDEVNVLSTCAGVCTEIRSILVDISVFFRPVPAFVTSFKLKLMVSPDLRSLIYTSRNTRGSSLTVLTSKSMPKDSEKGHIYLI